MQKTTTIFILLLAPLCIRAQEALQPYADYSFVPGTTILFEDNMLPDKTTGLPANWKLTGGKVSIGQQDNENYLSIDEYYTSLSPGLHLPNGLPDNFTIEYDAWLDAGYDGNPGVELHLFNGDQEALLTPNRDNVRFTFPSGEKSAPTPEVIRGEPFYNRWNHVALACENKQVRVWLNQFEVLSVPDCGIMPTRFSITGNTSQNMPIRFKNFKLATGVSQLARDFGAGKFVTQAIKFDVGQSTLKPESMGILRQIAQYLKANAGTRVEIGGHTDSDGDEASNLALSEQLAAAVRTQLQRLGIDATRLTTKGYGESLPLNKNSNPLEKSMNRRVEFTVLGK